MNFNNLAIEWLKTKKNYLFIREDKNYYVYNKEMSELLFASRIHVSNLSASKCYLISDDVILKKPHYRNDYVSFNYSINYLLYINSKMNTNLNNTEIKDTPQQCAIILDILTELKEYYEEKTKKYESFFEEVFFDINKKNINSIIADVENNLKTRNFDFEEFKVTYLDKLSSSLKIKEEIGIFYPVEIFHDIFEKKHHFLEINEIKFKRKDENLKKYVDKFYEKYEINNDVSKNIFSLNEYFVHPGITFKVDFAYLDPFLFIKKFKNELNYIINFISKKKHNKEVFFQELLEKLNLCQYEVVAFQNDNLINMIEIYRTNDEPHTIRQYIEK